MPACLALFEESKQLFEKAGEAKQVKDMEQVVIYLHQVKKLQAVPGLAAEGKAEDMQEVLLAARPCIVKLASLRAVGLRKWTGSASTALEHMDMALKFSKLQVAFYTKFRANTKLHLARKDLDTMSVEVRKGRVQ